MKGHFAYLYSMYAKPSISTLQYTDTGNSIPAGWGDTAKIS